MNKKDIITQLLPKTKPAYLESAVAFAPANIALCKYWGKRDAKLNLPCNSSLSISLADKGAQTKLSLIDAKQHQIIINDQLLHNDNVLAKNILQYLNLFPFKKNQRFRLETSLNIPIAAGIASSACGFAALVLALNQLFAWDLNEKSLSILARLGSGSACRSLWHGFVEWRAGKRADGMDSYANPITTQWDELRLGLLILSNQPKPLSSREAMQTTVETSYFYKNWLKQAKRNFTDIKKTIKKRNFLETGKIAESNALAMHAAMLASWPPIGFSLPETLAAIQKVWKLRKDGLPIFFTQDAGPNLKLLFLEKDRATVKKYFPQVEIIAPFNPVQKLSR